ncbi:hypothetical protein P7H22_16350 [Paenibacillus larvae]|nr:hypothetical protein [Paenibacillus larvae]MDT2241607.1 hypothetical protein [Paenibacillus larvae]
MAPSRVPRTWQSVQASVVLCRKADLMGNRIGDGFVSSDPAAASTNRVGAPENA